MLDTLQFAANLYVAYRLFRLSRWAYWMFFIERDGDSGRMGHFDDNPRIN